MSDTWDPFNVGSSVPIVYQHDDTSCWAAGIAMLVGSDLDTVLGEHKGKAMSWGLIEPIAKGYGLAEIYPQCGLPSLWRDTLSQHGAVWIVVKLGTGHVSHAVVLWGADSDGTMDGTILHYNDPISGPQDLKYSEFEDKFELGAASRANIFARS